MKRFNVAHQKVSVDVDLQRNCITGWTEMTVIPLEANLTAIELDARQLVVQSVQVNKIDADFVHTDPVARPPTSKAGGNVMQHSTVRDSLAPLLRDGRGRELVVSIPPEIDVTESNDAFATSGGTQNYAAITVRIVFELHNPLAGINFVTTGKPSSWHAYTTHRALAQSTSCWLPCIDGFAELCTFELEFSVPKTVGDITGDQEDETEVVVICNNNAPTQVAHPSDPLKKIVRFEIFTPMFAHHLGFTVGPFQQVPMNSSDESETSSGMPFCIFSLAEHTSKIHYCCGIYSKAMEYFTREFGSFPFGAYSICFVSDLPGDAADATGLSIVSDRLLFGQELIEPLFDHTQPLIRCLAAQWCGVNIVAASWNDVWVTEGIALYMTHVFIRRLMGNNEYRMRMRMFVDEITQEDINMPPIAAPQLRYPITTEDLTFIRLKAPMVLYILNRRMTKTDRSLGLSRVIPKILLQSMSGDLNSQISTAHFQKLCERVAHHRLDAFFSEWVYGSGYPIFRVTQRFNKKRMFIEMGIGQVQSREIPQEILRDTQFLDKAINDIVNERQGLAYSVAASFTGPMTIRIHEADGTPYEHVVDLKDSFTKLDIQYNTKYKRLKRNQKFKSQEGGADGDGGLINCLGDVLMKSSDLTKWKLTDWGHDEEEFMFNEAFEWVRVDSDFEWICKMFLGQPDYMYASQLQQDRDVVAQYDAVTFFSTQQPNPIYSSILTRTLMDWRYFYQVRAHAVRGLAHNATEQVDYLGKFHLLKAFEEMYCFEDSLIPRANDFTDFPNYFVQKALVRALSEVRDKEGHCPEDICRFLLDLIRYNENSGNPYSDSFYLSTVIEAVVHAVKSLDRSMMHEPRFQEFTSRVVSEIDKCQRLDSWLSSYHHIIITTGIFQEESLIRLGYGTPRMDKLLADTAPGNSPDIRLAAFQVLLEMGGYREQALLKYVFQTALGDESLFIRWGLLRKLQKLVGVVAIEGEYFSTKDDNNVDLMKTRHEAIARQTVRTAIPVLREHLGKYPTLRNEIWSALHDPRADAHFRRVLLDIAEVLYIPQATKKNYKLTVKRRGEDYVMVFRYRNVNKLPKLKLSAAPKDPEFPKDEEEEEEEAEAPPPPKLKLRISLA